MSNTGNRASEKLYVIYDGYCNLCLASVAKLKELHSKADLIFISIQQLETDHDTTRLIPRIDKLDFAALYEKMHVADERGQLFAGADGIVRILRTVEGFRWLSAFYRMPGMNRIADRIYRFVAKRRYEWFGSTEQSCSIDGCDLPQDRGERN
ncbi:DUF393 domain-containing protein [Paenibacillus sp. LHD-38]|uniref:thiol-disulfide oxidoreductase DCC family protein n=1 Tax=Paenibacillus sp. LHD-38 TaxID=3072143 RepID=UPI00280D4960|nr:DUF393 domain-containing protein [Paenibacillus sp. LHD-38]MDQ8737379.1 DUF393 domain-containing protein [Paenibacillus sp. LHD-38]